MDISTVLYHVVIKCSIYSDEEDNEDDDDNDDSDHDNDDDYELSRGTRRNVSLLFVT